eukprot:15436460-Alexandrium_andersonii.AAC.1
MRSAPHQIRSFFEAACAACRCRVAAAVVVPANGALATRAALQLGWSGPHPLAPPPLQTPAQAQHFISRTALLCNPSHGLAPYGP